MLTKLKFFGVFLAGCVSTGILQYSVLFYNMSHNAVPLQLQSNLTTNVSSLVNLTDNIPLQSNLTINAEQSQTTNLTLNSTEQSDTIFNNTEQQQHHVIFMYQTDNTDVNFYQMLRYIDNIIFIGDQK